MYESGAHRFLWAVVTAGIIGLATATLCVAVFSSDDKVFLVVLSVVAGISLLPCCYAISSYRKKFIACPKCRCETEIVKDDLLSENMLRENDKNGTKHYRVGARLVTIACETCDYTDKRELRFKERV